MPECAFCGRSVEMIDKVMRVDICPHCRRDLHCCIQCRFYDRGYHNDCRETRSEMTGVKDRANFCDFFEFGSKGRTGPLGDDSRDKLDELFGDGSRKESASADDAASIKKKKLEDLFK